MLATRDDVYQNFPSTAPTRYETLSAAQSLASLERALHTLLSPFDYSSAATWLDAACAAMSEVNLRVRSVATMNILPRMDARLDTTSPGIPCQPRPNPDRP